MGNDNRLRGATKVKFGNRGFKRKDFISNRDQNDFYFTKIKNRSSFELEVSGQKAKGNADVEIYELNGKKRKVLKAIGSQDFSELRKKDIRKNLKRVGRSRRKGKSDESLNLTLDSGIYYIRVYQREGSTKYKLNLSTSVPKNPVGIRLDKAQNTSIDFSGEVINGFTGNRNNENLYGFEVDGSREFYLKLDGLSDNSVVQLIQDLNTNGIVDSGEVLDNRTSNGNDPILLSRELTPGSYTVRVLSSPNNRNQSYELNLLTELVHTDPIEVYSPPTSEDFVAKDNGSIIDIMIAYTSQARQKEGGVSAINQLIQASVNEINQGYSNSGINPRLRLVHTAEVNYIESGDSKDDLIALKDKSDNKMDEIHALRDTYGADLVSLFVGHANAGSRGYTMSGKPSASFAEWAFSIVQTDMARNRKTLGHEIGHNFGAQHDKENAPRESYYPYGYGYTTSSGSGTIMSYAQERKNLYSSPNIIVNGEKFGNAATANNVKVFNDVALIAANWRASTVPLNNQPITTPPMAGPVPPPTPLPPSPSLRVMSPNGGNTFITGKSYWLNWTDNLSENVRLDLYKGGSYKSTISTSTASDGSFYWTVPTNLGNGSDYKLRIASTANSNITDFSDSNFTVKVDLKKYWFYYNYNPTNYSAADSYVGSVIAPVGTYRVTELDGSYTNSDFFDPRTSVTEMGLNGKYLVYGMEDYNDNLVNEAGRVFVNQYIDRDNGAERTFTPYKYSQGVQPSGTNYLGSEVDYIDRTSTQQVKFGQDYYEADLPDLKKYWFYYNYNTTNYSAADSYVGSVIAPVGTYRVIALDGSYINSDFFDPRTSATETGLNGKYLVYGMEDYNDRLINEAGRVFVNQYIDRDNGGTREYVPLKYSQGVQPSGTNYLGSEVDHIQSSSASTKFGLDYYEADPTLSTDITIDLDFFGNFTTTQRTLIERAADNWRNIITKDMVPEGRLNIAVTQGTTELDGTSWDPSVWALTDFPYPERTIATPRVRQNLYTPYDNIQGVDYHTRIHFNSYALPTLSSNLLVRLSTHEIGHALYLDEAQLDPLLGLDSVMDKSGLDARITAGVYSRLEYLGYGVNRSPVLNWV